MKNSKISNPMLWLLSFGSAFFAFMVFGCSQTQQITSVPSGVPLADLRHGAERIIEEGLADSNPRVRANAIEVVADTRQVKMIPKVQQLLGDKLVPVRFAAVLAVGDLEYRPAANMVKELLNDPDQNIIIAAAYTMERLGTGDSFEIIRKAAKSVNQTVRANAVMLLGRGGDKGALELLYWVMKDEGSDDKVRFQAAEAIAALGDEKIYPKLWTMLISVYADDRVMGIRAMRALGTVQAQNALITMLRDNVLEVRLAAAEHLGMLKDTAGEPEVLDVFRQKGLLAGMNQEERERVKVLASLAIGQIDTPAVTEFLPSLLEDESKFVRIAAARAVFQCSGTGTAAK